MGADRTIHLRPFIKIPFQYEEGERQIKTCGKHENFKGDDFCPKCGEKIITQKVPYKQFLSCIDLIGNENFYYYTDDDDDDDDEVKHMYIHSNLFSDSEINTDENIYTEITPELISSEIMLFKDKHKKDIELLENKIHQKVTVEFGFVYHVR